MSTETCVLTNIVTTMTTVTVTLIPIATDTVTVTVTAMGMGITTIITTTIMRREISSLPSY